jgi:hypothetical protein
MMGTDREWQAKDVLVPLLPTALDLKKKLKMEMY